MAYFLRKSNRPKGLYLQICFSYRDPNYPTPRQKSYKTYGYASDLIASGISDPVTYLNGIVKELNQEFHSEKEQRKVRQISQLTPERLLGFFPAASILRRLDVRKDIDALASVRNFQFSLSDCLFSLIYCRLLHPASKHKTCREILPILWDAPDCSYDQILSCLEFVGNEYEKIIEIFTRHTDETYILDPSVSFFDCTNFYFEIDREDEWRRKGPSKEQRKDPILGMGLLLERSCIPVAMTLYPGNQSEKPILRQSLEELRKQHNLTGKIVQVADKGLNCAQNIHDALSRKDGYLFSKSVRQLSDKERTWALNENGFVTMTDTDNEETFRLKSCVDTFSYSWTNDQGRKISFKVKEKRVVTFNPTLARKQKAEIMKMVEKAKGCCLYQAKKSEYGESSKYVKFSSADDKGNPSGKKAVTSLNEEKIKKDLECAGFNMLVTSEIEMDEMEIYNTYHELWRIEESFRTMKSELDARPVYLQDINRIKGHFLVCYLSVLVERLFQFKALENQYGSHQVYEFMRKFKITPYSNREYLNLSPSTDVIRFLSRKYNLPLMNCYLSKANIKKILETNL